ncbi:glycosyltransferase family 2 protein [Caballeronia sp. LjRoot31]
MPKVTVLMPVYNGEKYIADAIDSILAQTFTDFEFLIVDDGSTDRTSDIVATYAQVDLRIKIFHKTNSGVVDALNIGLTMSSGKYIARMDADDVALNNRLQRQVRLLDDNASVVACGSSFSKFGAKAGLVKMPETDAQCRLFQLIGSCFAHPSVMLRAETLKNNKLYYLNEYLYAEDYKLWADMSQYGSLINIQEPLLFYRIHNEQTGINKIDRQRAAHLKIALENFSYAQIPVQTDKLKSFLWPQIRGTYDVAFYIMQSFALIFGLLKHSRLRRLFFCKVMFNILATNSARLLRSACTRWQHY